MKITKKQLNALIESYIAEGTLDTPQDLPGIRKGNIIKGLTTILVKKKVMLLLTKGKLGGIYGKSPAVLKFLSKIGLGGAATLGGIGVLSDIDTEKAKDKAEDLKDKAVEKAEETIELGKSAIEKLVNTTEEETRVAAEELGGEGLVATDQALKDAGISPNYDYTAKPGLSQATIDRTLRLSEATGIPPAVIYGIETAEGSLYGPKALAWNWTIFKNDRWAKKNGVPDKALTDDQEIQARAENLHLERSYYGGEAKDALRKAMEINDYMAIGAGAWGLYQVLGVFTLPLHDNNVTNWLRAYSADPWGFSEAAFIEWVRRKDSKRPEWKKAANDGDIRAVSNGYYGEANDKHYDNIVIGIKKWYRLTKPRASEEDIDDAVEIEVNVPANDKEETPQPSIKINTMPILIGGDSQIAAGWLGVYLHDALNQKKIKNASQSAIKADALAKKLSSNNLIERATEGIVIVVGGNGWGSGIQKLVDTLLEEKNESLAVENIIIIGPVPAFRPVKDPPKMKIKRANWTNHWYGRKKANDRMKSVVEAAGMDFINPYDYADGTLFNSEDQVRLELLAKDLEGFEDTVLESVDGIHLDEEAAREFVGQLMGGSNKLPRD